MTQTYANPRTSKKPARLPVWRALIVPTEWTLAAAVKVLKSRKTQENRPCLFILINNKYFVFGTDEYEQETGEPFTCLVPQPELLEEWNRTRFVNDES